MRRAVDNLRRAAMDIMTVGITAIDTQTHHCRAGDWEGWWC